jgi:hypothetical protein
MDRISVDFSFFCVAINPRNIPKYIANNQLRNISFYINIGHLHSDVYLGISADFYDSVWHIPQTLSSLTPKPVKGDLSSSQKVADEYNKNSSWTAGGHQCLVSGAIGQPLPRTDFLVPFYEDDTPTYTFVHQSSTNLIRKTPRLMKLSRQVFSLVLYVHIVRYEFSAF